VVISKVITVRSANNDPEHTIIMGAKDTGTGSNGPAAVRCVYMVANSSLIGFTLTNGATLATGGGYYDYRGGGISGSVISNCIITGNSAAIDGGGAYVGTLYNCMIVGNVSLQQGGGAMGSTLNNCLIISNSTGSSGGGGYSCTLKNCLLIGNSGPVGAALRYSTAYNCTIVNNIGGGTYGGIYGVNCLNCIVYYNTPNNYDVSCSFTNSCTYPTQSTWTVSSGNITNNPLFVNTNTGNYRLSQGSPCVNAGANAFVTTNMPTDLDSHSRIDKFSGIVDMGCYEYLPSGALITVP
jgi:hypothetical protein